MAVCNRILIVEDDIDYQELFTDALRIINPGYVCKIAGNGEEALQILKQLSCYDIIVMDINMPKMDGIECLKILKKNPLYKHIPVVITSTSYSNVDINFCLSIGAEKYLTKPATFRELVEEMRTIFFTIFK